VATGDLTDLDIVKAWLGVTGTSSDDLLAALITAVSAFIPAYLGRQVLAASYVETYRGNGQCELLLRNFPITAVASVAFAGQTVTTAADPVALTSGFLFDDRLLRLVGYSFPIGLPVVVSYAAGYATTPPDIGQAALELVGEAFRRRERIGLASKSLGGQEVVAFSLKDMNDTIRALLASYQVLAPF
jgi:uncharacterized phiE125 gp8 family phage protein